jgi:hypothetical protein
MEVVARVGEPCITLYGTGVKEGNGGTRSMTFTVTLSVAHDEAVTVNFATAVRQESWHRHDPERRLIVRSN